MKDATVAQAQSPRIDVGAASIEEVLATRPDFTKLGRYAKECEKYFDLIQKLFGISAPKAEKICRQIASDAGKVLREVNASIRIGKPNADNKASISDAAKVKGVQLTNSLNIVRAIQWIDESGKNGVSYGFTQWKLIPPLEKYVDEIEV